MAGSPHAKAFGNALASGSQNAAAQRMASNNLKTSVAGQAARSADFGALAGLYDSDYSNQVTRRGYARKLGVDEQQRRDSQTSRTMQQMGGLLSPMVGALAGLLAPPKKKPIEQPTDQFNRKRRMEKTISQLPIEDQLAYQELMGEMY
jgi:hypothetical protein